MCVHIKFSLILIYCSCGLAFFGTPHDGGNNALLTMGKTSIAIVRGIFRDPPNDMIEALKHGSLFADVLQANWRHQLNLYKIVSFYEKEDKHHVHDNYDVLQNRLGLHIADSDRAKGICCDRPPWRRGESGGY